MGHINKKVACLLLFVGFFVSTVVFGAYEITLKGGSEIKQAAEILSRLISLRAIKLVMLIMIGFVFGLQGIGMISSSIQQIINGEQQTRNKGLLLGLMGIIFVLGGISIMFKDELIYKLKLNPRNTTVNTHKPFNTV